MLCHLSATRYFDYNRNNNNSYINNRNLRKRQIMFTVPDIHSVNTTRNTIEQIIASIDTILCIPIKLSRINSHLKKATVNSRSFTSIWFIWKFLCHNRDQTKREKNTKDSCSNRFFTKQTRKCGSAHCICSKQTNRSIYMLCTCTVHASVLKCQYLWIVGTGTRFRISSRRRVDIVSNEIHCKWTP